METTLSSHHKNVSTFIHLSTFCKYLFPFGNFIAPLIIWSAQKRDSPFIDKNGCNAINFQLSTLLYLIALLVISIPFFVYFAISAGGGSESLINNGYISDPSDFADLAGFLITAVIVGILVVAIFLVELIAVISAAVKASQGEVYKYPLTINFIKESVATNPEDSSPSDITAQE